jgi:ADP-ribosylglycohydrolase
MALAISLFSFLRHRDDSLEALFASVNHSGDSDSTGTICGAMLGAVHGLEWIPSDWLEALEHRDELMSLGEKLHEINADCK